MRSLSSYTNTRKLAIVTLAVSLALAGAPLSALAAGNVSLTGEVYKSASASTVSTGVVYAANLTTKQVYQSEQIVSGGAFSLEALPFGDYDIVVVHASKVYLANRVLSVAAGETMRVSFILEDPDPDDTEWWSAAPDREVPGLESKPDGVARIVEDEGLLKRFLEKGAPETPAATTTQIEARDTSWLLPLLIGTGIVAAGLLLTDDNDDAEDEDEPVSPFE